MIARHARVKIQYDTSDISESLAPFLKTFSFSDAATDEADDISITLEDRDELWESEWFPSKGSMLTVSIILSGWGAVEEMEIPLGKFEIDEIEVSGLPHECQIKAVSVPNNNSLRGICRNKAWENIKLSAIATEIASNAGLDTYLNIKDDSEIERVEQKEESDLALMKRLANEKSCGVRVSDTQLDVYYIPDLDAADPVAAIAKTGGHVVSYRFRTKTRDTYKGAHVRYENTKDGVLVEYTFNDPDKADGKILEIHNQVKDVAEAEKLAKSQLRDKNKDEVTGSISLTPSDTVLLAGVTVTLAGFHAFDGKYLVEKTSHQINNSGYSCSIDVRRCLNGY